MKCGLIGAQLDEVQGNFIFKLYFNFFLDIGGRWV